MKDGAAESVVELAQLCHVNRRRIAKWRGEGAPDSLVIVDWLRFLKDTGRTKHHDRLQSAIAPLDGQAPDGTAREGAAAATDLPAVAADPNAPEVPMPEADAGPAAWEKFWSARNKRQLALNAETVGKLNNRDLFPVAEVHDLLRATAASMLEAVGDSFWLALRPHLDGVPDTLRKTLRTAHDTNALDVRAKASALLRDKFAALTKPPAKPA